MDLKDRDDGPASTHGTVYEHQSEYQPPNARQDGASSIGNVQVESVTKKASPLKTGKGASVKKAVADTDSVIKALELYATTNSQESASNEDLHADGDNLSPQEDEHEEELPLSSANRPLPLRKITRPYQEEIRRNAK